MEKRQSEPVDSSVKSTNLWNARAVRADHPRRFGQAFDAAAIGMATMTTDGVVALCNAAFEKLFAPKRVHCGEDFRDCLVSADGARFDDAVALVASGKQTAAAVTVTIECARFGVRAMAIVTPVMSDTGTHADYLLLQLLEQTAPQNAEDEARLLLDVARVLASTSSASAGVSFVAQHLASAVAAEAVLIWFSDPEHNEPIVKAPEESVVTDAMRKLGAQAWRDSVSLWSADISSANTPVVLTANLASQEQERCAVVVTQLPTSVDTRSAQRVLHGVAAQLGPWVSQILATSALRLSEERHRVLIESATDAIVGADSGGRIVMWNDAASQMFGYEHDSIVGKPLTLIIPRRFQDKHLAAFDAAIAAGGDRRKTLQVSGQHSDGHDFPVEAAVSVSGSGRDALAFGIVRDVTERLRILSELEENERRLKDAERVAKMGSYEWDVASDTIRWSDELYRIYGLEPGETPSSFEALLGRIHQDDRGKLTETVKRAVSTGAGWSMDERIIRSDTGETRTLASVGEAVTDNDGKVIRICGTCRDVTEQRRAEAALRESEERFRLLVEGVRDYAIVLLDPRGNVATWNDGAANVTGFCAKSAIGQHLQTFFPSEDRREKVSALLDSAEATGSAETEGWQVRADGSRYWALTVVTRLMQAERTAGYAVLTRDISERREAEAALAESEARFRRGFDDAPTGMLLVTLVDDDAVVTRTNRALSYLLGYSNSELTSLALSQLVVEDDWPFLRETLKRVAKADSLPAQLEVRLRGIESRTPMVLAAASRIATAGEEPTLILHLEDITQRKEAEDQLRHRALHDPLTGLPNRDLLLDRLEGALARAARTHASVAVLFLDLDNFKLINDSIGHVAGDEMLRAVARRLIAVSRSGDTTARVGGDEFVMVCENVANEDEILPLAQRVSDTLSEPISIDGKDFVARVSTGIAVGREQSHSPEQLVRDADLAMYRAKQRGKNTIELFDEQLRQHAQDRVEIERQLRTGLQRHEIVPYYQPIVALDTGQLAGFEALARWKHPDRGTLLPRDFLSVAEDSHLIRTLGAQMLRLACSQLASWQQAAPNLMMSVNLSLHQLDGRFADVLKRAMEEARILASTLHLEVTESVLLDMSRSSGADLVAISDLGVRLGIDDFGTGYSSLVYLKRFPVRFLKIDRSFVDGLPDEPEDAAIVEAIVRLAQSLQLSTIAEGVETVEQLAALRRLGCSYAQGQLIAPPLAPSECTELLSEGRRW